MTEMRNHSISIQTQNKQTLFIPAKMSEALEYKNQFKDAKIVGGSTDLGVVVNKGKLDLNHAMALYHIDELKKIHVENNVLIVGACVTLTEFENYIETHFKEMSHMLHIFASPQIKNQATLVGNVINASPIADTIPFLMVSDCQLVIESSKQKREVLINQFYLGYKQLDLKSDEIVSALKIPLLVSNEKCKLYKVSMRKDLDISAVTFAFRAHLNNKRMSNVKIALGGVAATVVRLPTIESKLEDKLIETSLFETVAQELDLLISPLSDLRASKEYRMMVAKNFFKKCAIEIVEEL
jgi:xanthine dehydrogenase small subunit